MWYSLYGLPSFRLWFVISDLLFGRRVPANNPFHFCRAMSCFQTDRTIILWKNSSIHCLWLIFVKKWLFRPIFIVPRSPSPSRKMSHYPPKIGLRGEPWWDKVSQFCHKFFNLLWVQCRFYTMEDNKLLRPLWNRKTWCSLFFFPPPRQ